MRILLLLFFEIRELFCVLTEDISSMNNSQNKKARRHLVGGAGFEPATNRV